MVPTTTMWTRLDNKHIIDGISMKTLLDETRIEYNIQDTI